MDRDDASSAEMRRPPPNDPLALDDACVERLLSGTLPAASAPPGYAGVARLLAATVAPPTPRELAGQGEVLAELRAVARGRRAAAPVRPARPRRRRAGLAVVVVVGALATGGVAAATGHVPDPVREAARSVLGPFGGPAAPGRSSASPPAVGTAGTARAGPGGSLAGAGPSQRPGSAAAGPAAEPALDRLCRAFQEGNGGQQGGKLDATAFKALATAAGGSDKVAAFCQDLLATGAKAKNPKETKPGGPPDEAGQGQGGPPATTGGNAGGGGNGGGGGGGEDRGGNAPATSAPNRG